MKYTQLWKLVKPQLATNSSNRFFSAMNLWIFGFTLMPTDKNPNNWHVHVHVGSLKDWLTAAAWRQAKLAKKLS